MKRLQYLKALGDIAFLYAIFGTLFALLFGCSTAFAPIMILPLVLPVGYLLRGKPYRYLALALALLLIPFIESPVDILMPLVSLSYLFILLKDEAYHYVSYDEIDRFHKKIIALPFLIVFCALFGLGVFMAQYTIPITLLYLVSTNLFLRTIRADQATLAQPSFWGAHLLSLAGVFAAAILLSSAQLRSAVFGAIEYIYSTIVVPLLVGAAMVVLYAIIFVIRVIVWIFDGIELNEVASVEADYSVMQDLVEESGLTDYNIPAWLEAMITVVVGALVLLLLWYVFRKLLSGVKKNGGDDYVTITREQIDTPTKAKKPRLFLTPRQKLRNYYADFMRYAQKKGIRISRTTDTSQLEQKFGKNEQTTILTTAYRHARYDETRAVTEAEAAAAKAAFKALKVMHESEHQA